MEEKSRGYCNGHVKLVTAVPSDLLCQNPSNFCCRRNQWPAQPPQTPAHFPGLSPHRGSPSLMPATWVPSYSFPCSALCQSWGPTPASSLSLCSFSVCRTSVETPTPDPHAMPALWGHGLAHLWSDPCFWPPWLCPLMLRSCSHGSPHQ